MAYFAGLTELVAKEEDGLLFPDPSSPEFPSGVLEPAHPAAFPVRSLHAEGWLDLPESGPVECPEEQVNTSGYECKKVAGACPDSSNLRTTTD